MTDPTQRAPGVDPASDPAELLRFDGEVAVVTGAGHGPEELEPVLDVHVKGAFFVTRPAYEHMKSRHYGRIVLGGDSPLADRLDRTGDELEELMGPHRVAPVVAYLAHRSCALTGETLTVAGGRVGRIFVAATAGIHDPALSPESVAANLATIVDERSYAVPGDAGAEIDLLLPHLERGDRTQPWS